MKLSMEKLIIGAMVLIIGVFLILIFAGDPSVVAAKDSGMLFGAPSVEDLAADKCRLACENADMYDRQYYDRPSFPEGVEYNSCEELLNAMDGGDNSFKARCGYCVNLPNTRSSCTVGHKSQEWCDRDQDCEWVK